MFLKKELTEYNRYQAFAIHMAISLVIFFILLVCITQYWYPGILFNTGNGWKAIGMIAGIDLILGPLLTLIVFNHNKSSLKFDLSIIAVVQTAALIYGTWTIYSSRPIAIAYINKSFITLYANAENAPDIQQAVVTLKTNQLFYIFNDSKQTNELSADRLAPYALNANTVANTSSPYHESSSKDKAIWVQIDPLLTANRYLKIDSETGAILSFSHYIE